MTNEEAREQIDNLRAHCSNMLRHTFTDGEDIWGKDLEALDLAIKALDQESCEDCISRQAVLDVIEREEFKGDAISEIEKLSSAIPQPKMGQWNIYKLSQGGIDEEWLECSECTWSNALSIPRNYCPHCGAKMTESEEKE